MISLSHRVSFAAAGIAILNALLFAAKGDWTYVAIAIVTAVAFVMMGLRKLRAAKGATRAQKYRDEAQF